MEKFTPPAKILHCRRHWRDGQIPLLYWHLSQSAFCDRAKVTKSHSDSDQTQNSTQAQKIWEPELRHMWEGEFNPFTALWGANFRLISSVFNDFQEAMKRIRYVIISFRHSGNACGPQRFDLLWHLRPSTINIHFHRFFSFTKPASGKSDPCSKKSKSSQHHAYP